MSEWTTIAVIAGASLVAFALFWIFVTFMISLLGWRAVAAEYRATSPFRGEKRRWEGGFVGIARYNNVLTVGADPAGLSVSVFPLFRAGSPPLFIPWEDVIELRREPKWFNTLIVFSLRRTNATVRLWDTNLEEFLRWASGGQMPPSVQAP